MKKLELVIKTLTATAMLAAVFGCSAGSNSAAAPAGPASDNQPAAGSPKVKLAWASNLGEQQGFNIEESADGVNFTQVQQVPDGTNTVTVTVPTVGQNYYFRIRGYNQAGNSPYSSVVTVMVAQ